MYKHLFFDLDHTLWDFEANSRATLAHIYDAHQLAEKGVGDFERFRLQYEMHNDRMWTRYRNGFMTREELKWKRMWLTLIDFKIGDEKFAKALSSVYLDMLPTQGRLMPHTIEVLEYCKKSGYALHLITNGFEDTQWKKLHTSGISNYFTQVITSEKSNSLKPYAAIFDYALAAAGAALDGSLMIGDNMEADILGAKNYGMHQVYFNPKKQLHDEQPTYEIACLSELKEIL